jgi:hypothetical protein
MTTTMNIPSAPRSRGSGGASSRVVVGERKIVEVCRPLLGLSSFKKESCFCEVA